MMKPKLGISPQLVKNVASLYTDVNRILMEFVDNSLDSAENFYNAETNSYSRQIDIKVRISGDKHSTGKIVISDNCYGITNFEKIVSNIGLSDKRSVASKNGMFGYGIYSFLKACEELVVKSTLEGKNYWSELSIKKKDIDVERVEDAELSEIRKIPCAEEISGTEIVLRDFIKDQWIELDTDIIKKEIENHFENILMRNNLKICVIKGEKSWTCKPFDYESIEGDVIEEKIKILRYKKKNTNSKVSINLKNNPLHIFIKITPKNSIEKPPFFTSKGRRIENVKDLKSFKTKNKTKIWSHPHITGFIDLPKEVPPNISRNELVSSEVSKALFSTLLDVESLIEDELKKINKSENSEHYKKLSDKLSNVLSKLSKKDGIFEIESTGKQNVNNSGGKGSEFEEGYGTRDHGSDRDIKGTGPGIGLNEGDGVGLNENGGALPSKTEGGNNPHLKDFIDGSNPRKKSGILIEINENDPPVRDDKAERSQYTNNTIIIYRKHTDFINRVRNGNDGKEKITSRLISYLASEITVHYKDIFQQKHGQPEYNKNMFVDLVDFIYQIESEMEDLEGKNLVDEI